MTRVATLFPAGVLMAVAAALLLTPTGRAAVGYVEDFALAKDRAAAFKPLIPGTEDYYYYHALHLLNTAQYDKVDPILRPWGERHGRTARLADRAWLASTCRTSIASWPSAAGRSPVRSSGSSVVPSPGRVGARTCPASTAGNSVTSSG